MKAGEWWTLRDPKEMLAFLGTAQRLSERKARLFAAACCRRIWQQIQEVCSRRAIETSEDYADGRISFAVLEEVFSAADRAYSSPSLQQGRGGRDALDAARLAAHPERRGLADGTATAAAMARAWKEADFWDGYNSEEEQQCILLRDIFGNPFCRLPRLTPSLLTANGGLVAQLAHVAYEERILPEGRLENARLAVLADALEEAGCTNEDILLHLRQQEAVHVRGCFALDWILGQS